MSVDSIVAWLRVRDLIRWRRDFKRAEDSVKDLKEEASSGESAVNQLGGALSQLAGNLPSMTGRTRIFGFAVGTVITAIIAVIPLVVGLGGAAVAVAGSLGAAALGAGLLATSVAGAAVPLGFLGLVALSAATGFSKVTTAWTNYNRQVASFGKNSTQAETALQRLQGYVRIYGGPIILKAVRAWYDLQNRFLGMNKPAMRVAMSTFLQFIQVANKILPWFASITHDVAVVLKQALQPVFQTLGGSEFKGLIETLTDAFAAIAGPVVRSALNVLMGLLQIAARLSPHLAPMADGLERISIAFRNWATHGNLSPLISQFMSWWELLKAVSRLLFDLLSAGARQGQGLVRSLTDIVNKWDEWIKANPDSVIKFFQDSARMTKQFAGVLAGVIGFIFKFGRALVPIYTVVFKALRTAWGQLMHAFAPAAPFFKNILGPLLKGFAEGVIGGLVGSWKLLMVIIRVVSKVLGVLGRAFSFLRGPIEFVGKVLGFFFGPGIVAKIAEALGKISILLGPLAAGFKLLVLPITAAGKLVGWVLGKFANLVSFLVTKAATAFSPFRSAVGSVLRWLSGAGRRFFDAGARLWNYLKDGLMNAIGSGLGFAGDLAKSIANSVIGLLNSAIPNKIPIPGLPDIDLPDNPIPKLALGGVVSGSGSWITGEAGPEVNTLRNGRVTVVPLTPSVSAQSSSATLLPNEGNKVIVSKVYLRGRQIAEAVADEAADEKARR